MLWFPFLSVDRLVRTKSFRSVAPGDAPFELVEKVRGAIRIGQPCPDALALGLTPGLALAAARPRVTDVTVFDADPGADQSFLERLPVDCARSTPMGELDPPTGPTR